MSMKILVAEDDPRSRQLLEETLAADGYTVVSANDGEQAWQILNGPDAPLLGVLDWEMPGLTGLEICRQMQVAGGPCPPYLILVTARTDTVDMVAGLRAGASDYLGKPFYRSELLARVEVGRRMVEVQAQLAGRVRELEEARGEVHQLQDILPICSYCRKVRDGRDYWQQVESYFAKHSNLRFSHGCCPECEEKVLKPMIDAMRPPA